MGCGEVGRAQGEEDEEKREPDPESDSSRRERAWRSWKDGIEGNALGGVGRSRSPLGRS